MVWRGRIGGGCAEPIVFRRFAFGDLLVDTVEARFSLPKVSTTKRMELARHQPISAGHGCEVHQMRCSVSYSAAGVTADWHQTRIRACGFASLAAWRSNARGVASPRSCASGFALNEDRSTWLGGSLALPRDASQSQTRDANKKPLRVLSRSGWIFCLGGNRKKLLNQLGQAGRLSYGFRRVPSGPRSVSAGVRPRAWHQTAS
jgi:hypothetical protein